MLQIDTSRKPYISSSSLSYIYMVIWLISDKYQSIHISFSPSGIIISLKHIGSEEKYTKAMVINSDNYYSI